MEIGFVGPFVNQYRNKHLHVADLHSEQPLHTKSKELMKWLLSWNYQGTIHDRLMKLLIDLYEIGVIDQNDVYLYHAWIQDLELIQYKPPFPATERMPDHIHLQAENPTATSRTAVSVSGQLRTMTMKPSDADYPNNWGL